MKTTTWVIDIPPEECEELLAGSSLGRLAVLVDGRPQIFPVNHVFDRESRCVAFPTNAGTKLHAALDWPFVAFEIDAMDETETSGWSVLVGGHAEEITDKSEITQLSSRRTVVWRASEHEQWIRIVADTITGRRIFGSQDS